MPRKIDLITELYKRTIKDITSDSVAWRSFLASAAYQYKYPFADQVLIYAQRPYATACAETQLWNNHFGRWIKRGATGIALIEGRGDRNYLKYVFDVSDTHHRENKPFDIWGIKPEYNKGYFQSSVLAKAGNYEKAGEISKARVGNYGAKIGIIGAGMIGRKVIELLEPYKLDILVYDVFMTEEQANAMGVKKSSLEEIFSTCHIVSNHLANVPATQGILKKEHFEAMMNYATFINTGRGAQVEEDGMLEVLEKREDLCALLDVTISEPPVEGSKFYTLPNVFLSPHIAGSQGWEVRRMAELVIDEFENYLNGRPTPYEITPEKLAKMA